MESSIEQIDGAEIRPFRIEIPEEDLDDLRRRLARTRIVQEIEGVGNEYGMPAASIERLIEYWQNGFDWRALETKLNALPQFTTTIDGQNIHFIHVKSPEPNALPVVMTHGWPVSILEYVDLIGPLTNPRAYGGDPADAFDVVIPSLPGFGFSGPTTERGWNRYRIARAFAELMARLGYERYGAVGNDIGSLVSPEIGRADPEHCLGVHVTQVFSFPSGDPAEFANLSEADMEAVRHMQWFWENVGGYNKVQAQVPQNIGQALADSPAGQLAWSCQLLGEGALSDEFIVSNVAIYWLTNTGASSARLYFEDAHAPEKPTEPTTVPLGLANFAWDFQSMRPFAERDHKNIVSWHVYQTGGHFSARMAPDVLVSDIRGFYRGLRDAA